MLEQRLRVLARGAELVADGRDRGAAVALADGDHARLELGEWLGMEMEIAAHANHLTGSGETAEALGGLGGGQPDGFGQFVVGARLASVGAKQRGDLKSGLVERRRLRGYLGSRFGLPGGRLLATLECGKSL